MCFEGRSDRSIKSLARLIVSAELAWCDPRTLRNKTVPGQFLLFNFCVPPLGQVWLNTIKDFWHGSFTGLMQMH